MAARSHRRAADVVLGLRLQLRPAFPLVVLQASLARTAGLTDEKRGRASGENDRFDLGDGER